MVPGWLEPSGGLFQETSTNSVIHLRRGAQDRLQGRWACQETRQPSIVRVCSLVVESFTGPVLGVAEGLLGKRLVTRIGGGVTTSVLICEVEAYGGVDDPASHAFGGPRKRNRTMFSEAGTLYVYRSYGVHWCANVVTGPEGEGQAVLLRGGMPEWGVKTMIARRGRDDHLCDGPGKLTQALGLDGSHDGLVLSAGREAWLEETGVGPPEWMRTPRVGISKATERPWRLVAIGMGYRSPHGMKRGVL